MRLLIVLAAALVAAPAFVAPSANAATATQTTGVLNSFDGTPIVYTLDMPAGADAAHPVPAILMTHGWAGSRDTSLTGIVGKFLAAGFAVLTWDSRGFGQSGGFIELDSPAYEVKDASKLIDLLATTPGIALNAPGDPIVGMHGSSYAGGIQLLTAAFDHRVDAITPDITWNDLRQSLGPGGVPKELWIQVLFGAGAATGTAFGTGLSTSGFSQNPAGPQAQSYDANLPLWYAEVHATNGMTGDVYEGLRERSTSAYIGNIRAPTLFTQGLPDTLFNPNEAMANYQGLLANGVDARLLLYCGGHAGCPYVADDAHVDTEVVDWLSHYLLGTAFGAPHDNVEWQTNDGAWHSNARWPPANARWLHAGAEVKLESTPAPTGGGAFAVGAGGLNAQTPSAPTADGVTSALVPVDRMGGFTVNGIGRVHVDITGEGTEAFLFFRLVDATSGTILDGQTQAFRMPISPLSTSHADIDLVGVSYVIPAGHTLALQVTTNDFAHAGNRQPGAYDVSVSVDVPTTAA